MAKNPSTALSAALGVLGLGQDVLGLFGFIEDEVVVRVTGSPYSTKRELYEIAAAVGFGLVNRKGPVDSFIPPPGMIMINYSATSKEVEFTLRYRNSLAVAAAMAAKRGFGANLGGHLPVVTGPSDEVQGGRWNFTGPGIGFGAPAGLAIGAPIAGIVPPKNNWADKVVLTNQLHIEDPIPGVPANGPLIPTPNPRPVGDFRSRGSLVSLVFTALSQPGSADLMRYPDPQANTSHSGS